MIVLKKAIGPLGDRAWFINPDGEWHGYYIQWHPGTNFDQIRQIGRFKKGRRSGAWYWLDHAGMIASVEFFLFGIFNERLTAYLQQEIGRKLADVQPYAVSHDGNSSAT